jgi:hypothetical protein
VGAERWSTLETGSLKSFSMQPADRDIYGHSEGIRPKEARKGHHVHNPVNWEGWEGSEERREEEYEEALGVIWVGEPPEEGLDAVGGGIVVTTPKGRKIIVGMRPGELSEEGHLIMGRAADNIMDEIQEKMEGTDSEEIKSWVGAILFAVKEYMSGENPELLWKMGSVFLDYERSVHLAEEKGYRPDNWTMAKLIGQLPALEEEEDAE